MGMACANTSEPIPPSNSWGGVMDDLEKIRTFDRRIRNSLLYPTELPDLGVITPHHITSPVPGNAFSVHYGS